MILKLMLVIYHSKIWEKKDIHFNKMKDKKHLSYNSIQKFK